jgi:hypothetical protein
MKHTPKPNNPASRTASHPTAPQRPQARTAAQRPVPHHPSWEDLLGRR